MFMLPCLVGLTLYIYVCLSFSGKPSESLYGRASLGNAGHRDKVTNSKSISPVEILNARVNIHRAEVRVEVKMGPMSVFFFFLKSDN